MSTTAFGVRQTSEGVGCTDVSLRKITGALYPDKGIVSGLEVSGQNGTYYKVGEGVAVCSKGDADGNTLAHFEGGTVDVSANAASNPRIDVIWLTSHDVTQGDSDNLVTLGVTQGTAAATPAEPSIPTYATKLCAMKVPANATTTASATKYGEYDYAVPYGSNRGLLLYATNNTTGGGDMTDGGKDHYDGPSGSFYVPTHTTIELVFFGTMCAANYENTGPTTDDADMGAYFFCIQVDGKDVDGGGVQVRLGRPWTNFRHSTLIKCGPGYHTVRIRQHRLRWGRGPWFLSGTYTVDTGSDGAKGVVETYPPRTLQVWDRGVTD